jgi:hypothetical protein
MASKLSLLDVLPRRERVGIGGGDELDVYGISGEDLGRIMERYPDAFEHLIQYAAQPMKMNPGMMGAFLAATQRNGGEESLLGNEIVERRARSLGLHVQIKMLLAMGRCTFPDGVGPFLRDYELMSSATSEAITVIVQAASKAQAMESQPTQKPSEQPDIRASGS